MNALLSLTRKEIHHILRDVRTLIILFGIPIAQILIFGYVVSTDLREAQVAVVAPKPDGVIHRLIAKIDASRFFHVTSVLTHNEGGESLLRSGRIKLAVVFEHDFGETLVREGTAPLVLLIDGSEPNTARLVASHMESIIASANQEWTNLPASKVPFRVESRMVYNPTLQNAFLFIPGLMALILTLVCALMTSVTIVREKEFGTLELLLVSPLNPYHIIIGKVLSYLAIGFIDVLLILGMAHWIFHLPIRGSLALLLIACAIYILLALSLGILISTLSKTMDQAIFICYLGLMVPVVILSGFIFPIDSMPKGYQIFSLFFPPRWFIQIIRAVMLKGAGLGGIWKELLILSGMASLLIGIGVKRFRMHLS